jgi:hypothetical protein
MTEGTVHLVPGSTYGVMHLLVTQGRSLGIVGRNQLFGIGQEKLGENGSTSREKAARSAKIDSKSHGSQLSRRGRLPADQFIVLAGTIVEPRDKDLVHKRP